MYAYVGSIEYIFYIQPTENKVFITLEKRWQSSPDENITYGSVMDKFMWEKLQASPVKD